MVAHLLELSGEILFNVSIVSDIGTFGPPDRIDTISSTLASKKTLVKNALERTLYIALKAVIEANIFSLDDFKSFVMLSKPSLWYWYITSLKASKVPESMSLAKKNDFDFHRIGSNLCIHFVGLQLQFVGQYQTIVFPP